MLSHVFPDPAEKRLGWFTGLLVIPDGQIEAALGGMLVGYTTLILEEESSGKRRAPTRGHR